MVFADIFATICSEVIVGEAFCQTHHISLSFTRLKCVRILEMALCNGREGGKGAFADPFRTIFPDAFVENRHRLKAQHFAMCLDIFPTEYKNCSHHTSRTQRSMSGVPCIKWSEMHKHSRRTIATLLEVLLDD